MTDLRALETELLAAVAAANDEAALEAVRVAALGRNGSVSALLKTLGAMTPETRKEQGPLINSLKDRVTAALAARKDALRELALEQRLNTETVDVTLPVREPPATRPGSKLRASRRLARRVRSRHCWQRSARCRPRSAS